VLLRGGAGNCKLLQFVEGCCSGEDVNMRCCKELQGIAGCYRVLQSISQC